MTLNARSINNLEGVHADLVAVVEKAAEKAEFYVTEGVRSQERQLELVKAGKSQTKNSRHLYGLAVDLCDCDGCYDVPDMTQISRAMKSAAAELGIDIEWGGDWKTFKDTPHFELSRKTYPDDGAKKPFVVKPGTPTKVAVAGAVATAANQAAPLMPIPAIPSAVTDSLTALTAWQGLGDQIWTFAASLTAHPLPSLTAGVLLFLVWVKPLLGLRGSQ